METIHSLFRAYLSAYDLVDLKGEGPPATDEQLEKLAEKLQKCATSMLAFMAELQTHDKREYFKANSAWRQLKTFCRRFDNLIESPRAAAFFRVIYHQDGWVHYRKVRDFWHKKSDKYKLYRAEYDRKRREDPEWKAKHAARMKEFRAKKSAPSVSEISSSEMDELLGIPCDQAPERSILICKGPDHAATSSRDQDLPLINSFCAMEYPDHEA